MHREGTWPHTSHLQRDAGTYRLRHGFAEVGVPDTIQGIIAARLDRLSEAGKHTVQLASVLGRQFPVRLLAELVEMPGPLDDLLRELQAREIIERRGLVPEPTYGFTHAVIQEVAYNSLLLRQRQAIHHAVGAAMEAWYPERLAEHAAEVAHHFLEGERWPKAMAYSTLAGDRAAEAYANAEAAAHYARAVHAAAQCAPLPEAGMVARLHAKHGAVLMVLAAYDEAVAAYQRALSLMQEIGDQRGEIEILLGLSTVYTNTHSFGAAPAVEAMARALTVARALHDRALQAVCLASQVRVRTRGYGQLREAMADAEEAVHLARDTQNPKLLAETLVALGRVLQWQGAFARGRTALQEGATLAQQGHAGFLSGMALFFLGNTATAQGAYDEALQWYQQLQDYAATAVDRYWIARVPNTIGGLHLELFDLDTALELTLEGDEAAQQGTGWSEVRGHALVKAGLASLLRGEHGRAEACFRRADALLETDIWMRWRWHIVLLRGWGELALAQGRYDDAWTYALQSLALATQTDSQKHVTRAEGLQGAVLAARGQLAEAVPVLEASIRRAAQLQTPRELWMGQAALGQVFAQLGRDAAAEHAYRQATQTLDALAARLRSPQLRRALLSAAPVLEVYTAVGSSPPQAS